VTDSIPIQFMSRKQGMKASWIFGAGTFEPAHTFQHWAHVSEKKNPDTHCLKRTVVSISYDFISIVKT
jgi:hypothetical protein